MNALAHAVETLYAKDVPPLVAMLAEEGIYKVGRSLDAIAAAPDDAEARTEALYGAWLCGRALGAALDQAIHCGTCSCCPPVGAYS